MLRKIFASPCKAADRHLHTLRALDNAKGEKSPYGRRLNAIDALFSGGWLVCGQCGCQITYDPKEKRNRKTNKVTEYHYYHCSNGKKMHTKQVNINENRLWQQFEAAVDAVNIPESFAKKISDALNENYLETKAATKRQIEDCGLEIDELDKRKDMLFDLFMNREIECEDFEIQTKRLKDERNRLLSKLEEFQNIINGAHLETARSIIELAINAKSLWKQGTPIERRNILETLLSNRSLNGASVEFDLKKPFKILSEMKEKMIGVPKGI